MTDIDLTTTNFSVTRAIEIFNLCKHVLDIEIVTEKSRKRRIGQLSWFTICSIMRKKKRTYELVI
jgi:hypothetical protein